MSNVNKVERYDWVKPGDNGLQCKVAVDDVKIDHAYQRHEVDAYPSGMCGLVQIESIIDACRIINQRLDEDE